MRSNSPRYWLPWARRRTYFAVAMIAIASSPIAKAQNEASNGGADLPMPQLKFTETPNDVENYDKYFYFHRTDTNFDQALRDLIECDDLASARPRIGGAYGAVGNAFNDLLYGSAYRRELRRLNMRRCMGYKGYRRYGLSKALWTLFNFEEGLSKLSDMQRLRYLKIQAKVASEAAPDSAEIAK